MEIRTDANKRYKTLWPCGFLKWILQQHVLLLMLLAVSVSPAMASEKAPLSIQVHSRKTIYGLHEGIQAQLVFTAIQKTRLCLASNLMQQLQFSVVHQGSGVLAQQPVVINQPSKTTLRYLDLEPGQSIQRRVNLKQIRFQQNASWPPGEYQVKATFFLCEQQDNPGQNEIPVVSQNRATFLILH
jgi:hypothetical protein